MSISHCESKGCRQVFTSTSAFEMHRTGTYGDPIYTRKGRFKGYTTPTRRCLSVAEMHLKGMVQNERGQWSMSRMSPDALVQRQQKSA